MSACALVSLLELSEEYQEGLKKISKDMPMRTRASAKSELSGGFVTESMFLVRRVFCGRAGGGGER
jgi:hypothetical protein